MMTRPQKVGLGGSGGKVHDSPAFIHCDPAPAVCSHFGLIPSVITELFRKWNRMEGPKQLAGNQVVSVDIFTRSGDDKYVFVDGPGSPHGARIYIAPVTEFTNGRARFGIEGKQVIAGVEENSARVLTLALPVHEPT